MLGLLLAVMPVMVPAAYAQSTSGQPSVETLMYYMTEDRDVGKARKLYRSSVQTAMLYSQCAAEYKVDDAKRTTMDRVLYGDEMKLRKAFEIAHQKLTYKLPNDAVLNAVNQYIVDYRNNEAIELGTFIKSRKAGCRQTTLERLDAAYQERQAIEAHTAAQATAAEEKRRQEAPAVNQQPTE